MMDRNVSVITDLNGNKIVVINDIIFKGKRSVNWDDVEAYLKQYVGEFYEMADSKDIIYIGTDLPDEYSNSNYTKTLKGANAKAKANAAHGLPELIQIATEKNLKKIGKNVTTGMQNTDGIAIHQDLHFPYLMMQGK